MPHPKKHKLQIAVIILVMAAILSFLPEYVSASTPYSVGISVTPLHSKAAASSGGEPLLYTGVWNYVNITVNPFPASLNITAFLGNAFPENGSMLDLYEWSYSSLNKSWYDPLYNSFINASLSEIGNGTFSFVCGMYDKAISGTWTMQLTVNSTMIYEGSLAVSQPSVGLTVSAPDFSIYANPFETSLLNSSTWQETAMIQNTGDLPETIGASFNSTQSYIQLAENGIVLQPGSATYSSLIVNAGNWSPQVIPFSGFVVASSSGAISVGNNAQLIPEVDFPISGDIIVGHYGYVLGTFANFTIEYEHSLSLVYGRMGIEKIYLTGNGTIQIGASLSSPFALAYISSGSANGTTPLTLQMLPYREYLVTVGFREGRPATAGTLSLTLFLPNSPQTRSYAASIAVTGLPSQKAEGGVSAHPEGEFAIAFAAFAVLATAAIMLFIRKRHGERIPSGRRDSISNSLKGNSRSRNGSIRHRKDWGR